MSNVWNDKESESGAADDYTDITSWKFTIADKEAA